MRVEGDFIKINKWLLPLSALYGTAIKLRNMAFEVGILKSRSFDVPVISVGNITVGGTGKTPHVEYMVKHLKDLFHVAVLSRGYKRKSKGFIIATSDIDKTLDVILLDDAFQHRYVKPGINILLVDYHRLVIYDTLLPAGRLREPLTGKDRADIVIITKCPKDLKPMEFRVITKAMSLYPYQQLFFTTLEYGELNPIFGDFGELRELKNLKDYHILLLTGIASPEQMTHDLTPLVKDITPLTFADHHRFKAKDIQLINETFDQIPQPCCVITTEKDATRLYDIEGLSEKVRKNIYTLPVNIRFMQKQEDTFNQYIISYVRKNSRNSILAKRKNDNQSQDSHHSGDRPRTISFRDNR